MTKLQSWVIVGVSAAALMIGVLLATGTFTSAQSATPTPAPTSGAFKSNEDPTHEAGESAEREAQEDAGMFPGGGKHRGGSNEDAAHEASESPEREAQENANQAPATVSPTPGA